MADICTWTGASGKKYEYAIYSMSTEWNDVPGNYIFTKKTEPRKWSAVYIGQTESFKDRLPYHDELPCIESRDGQGIFYKFGNGPDMKDYYDWSVYNEDVVKLMDLEGERDVPTEEAQKILEEFSGVIEGVCSDRIVEKAPESIGCTVV